MPRTNLARLLALSMISLAAACSTGGDGGSGEGGAGDGLSIGIVYFAPDPGAESCTQGLLDRLAETGFVEGRNLEVLKSHAQGEIANIPSLLENYENSDVDVIVTFTTPCLTAACASVKSKPVVFTYVYDPIAAGAGESRTEHIANITGVGSFPPIEKAIDLIQELKPGVKAIGTLYNSSEANSRKVVSVAREVFAQRGLKLEEVTVTSSNEVFQAAQALTSRDVDALWISGDNTALLGFEGVVKAAEDAKLPLVINDPEFVDRGALAAAGLGWYQSGYAAGKLVSQVLLGDTPENMPIEEVAVETLSVNFEVARRLGVTFSPDLLARADAYWNLAALRGRPAKIGLAAPSTDWKHEFAEALSTAGLVEGEDYELADVDPASASNAGEQDAWVVADEAAAAQVRQAFSSGRVIAAAQNGGPRDPESVALELVRGLAGAGD